MIKEFEQTLKERLNRPIEVTAFDTVDSTNTFAKDIAKKPNAKNTVVVALSQTAGRGRLTRSFFSQNGVYISVLLFPETAPQTALLMTVAAAVAVCRGLEKHTEKQCKIKWVNDVFIDDKKVCGILTESAASGEKLDYAVVGIGINLEKPSGDFPKEISDIAAAVFENQNITAEKKAVITADVLNEFFDIYEKLENKDFLEEYRSRSWLDGKIVTYVKNSVEYTALVEGIDGCGSLVVTQDGKREVLNSGEVSVKAK